MRFWPRNGMLLLATLGLPLAGCNKRAARYDEYEGGKIVDLTYRTDSERRRKLTPEQYHVCTQNGTEPARYAGGFKVKVA